jgi:hypothetical protein
MGHRLEEEVKVSHPLSAPTPHTPFQNIKPNFQYNPPHPNISQGREKEEKAWDLRGRKERGKEGRQKQW